MLEVSDDSLTSVDRYDDYGVIPNGATINNPLATDISPTGISPARISSNPGGATAASRARSTTSSRSRYRRP